MTELEREQCLNRLKEIKECTSIPNWNGYNAMPIPPAYFEKAEALIEVLSYKPEIFPTACSSIQFDYTFANNAHIECELYLDGTADISMSCYNTYMIDKTIKVVKELYDTIEKL